MLILSAAVARGTFVLCEYDASTGADDLTEISRKVLPKIPRTGAIRSYVYGGHTFNYLLDKDRAGSHFSMHSSTDGHRAGLRILERIPTDI
eukprot:g8118.t1